ncbi:hypothetical protein ONZ45_g126 [Pleurotus djamor]|nr:hypothetical protein ONZ45_g126 [Pleurotus djamor]
MTTTAWQDAWERTQPRLEEIWKSLRGSATPSPRPLRVGQLDSELLDQELVQLLQEPLKSALALLNLTLYKLSMWNTGSTYGASLQDLRYTTSTGRGGVLTPSGLPRRTLLFHGGLTILLPYLHARLRARALSNSWPEAPSSDIRRRLWDLMTSTESLWTFFALANFVAFLWNGKYRALADRLLGMMLVPSRRLVKRDVSYEFMNRQMVWHAFTEFLLFLLPLINTRSLSRRITRLLSFLNPGNLTYLLPSAISKGQSSKQPSAPARRRGLYWKMPADQCAICAENASVNLNPSDPSNAFSTLAANIPSAYGGEVSEQEPPSFPINTPYIASCGDVYCYHCIAERLVHASEETEGGWECVRCAEVVKSAERLTAPESEVETTSDYEFSSDLDATDMSASVGSFTGSGYSEDY